MIEAFLIFRESATSCFRVKKSGSVTVLLVSFLSGTLMIFSLGSVMFCWYLVDAPERDLFSSIAMIDYVLSRTVTDAASNFSSFPGVSWQGLTLSSAVFRSIFYDYSCCTLM